MRRGNTSRNEKELEPSGKIRLRGEKTSRRLTGRMKGQEDKCRKINEIGTLKREEKFWNYPYRMFDN